jgi:hypothetical protein
LHHTIGLPNFSEELRCFQPVTCHQVTFSPNSCIWIVCGHNFVVVAALNQSH